MLLLVGLPWLAACERESNPASALPVPTTAEFVGSAACVNCHASQYSDWQNSHHDLAMQVANATTVLGDFATTIDYFGMATEFAVDGDDFTVRTANESGEQQTYRVTHTFGITPLQQYLVEFPGGKLQTLPFAWDTRPAAAGGQRWFHVYGEQPILPGDELYWTGRQQNWNYMCAECHSTDLQVNYDVASDSFDTTWSEINVGCEGCHGPASIHVAQAQRGELRGRNGLQVDLDDHGRAVWQMDPATGIARRSELATRQSKQPEACGRCHARRGLIHPDYEYGVPLADTHRPALLNAPLYYDDGQILDEVYVYGSFLQSRMYQAGVTCSDCHNPHSLELVTGPDPNDVCAQCHLPTRFASTEHHHHPTESVACVDCHMPATDYMQVDPRRDHSFRIPRPDLTVQANAPSACSDCHADHSDAALAAAAATWWGEAPTHFATAFAAARSGAGNAPLREVAGDTGLPGIVRATALSEFTTPLADADARAVQAGLADADPLVRLAALHGVRFLPPELQVRMLAEALRDTSRSVRLEAARLAAPVQAYLPPDAGFAAAADEFRDAQMAIASRPEAHVALGDFETALGNPEAALQHYAVALAQDPGYAFSRLNYADALRRFGDEAAAEKMLRDGLERNAADADLQHSLGLLLVRTERSAAGLDALLQAAELAPDNPRYAYVVGVALNSMGKADAAIDSLRGAQTKFPNDYDIAIGLAAMLRDQNRASEARSVLEALLQRRPDDANAAAMLRSLDAA